MTYDRKAPEVPVSAPPAGSGWSRHRMVYSDPYRDWVLGTGRRFIAGASGKRRIWFPALVKVDADNLEAECARSGSDDAGLNTHPVNALSAADLAGEFRGVEDVGVPPSAEAGTRKRSEGRRDCVLPLLLRLGDDGHVRCAPSVERPTSEGGETQASADTRPGAGQGSAAAQIATALRPGRTDADAGESAVIDMMDGFDRDGLVVVGVIDDGIAFANGRFRLPGGGSRVAAAWLQDVPVPVGETVCSGREWTRAEIDAAIGRHTYVGLLDEDAFYAEIGCNAFAPRGTDGVQKPGHKTVARRASHGTHVLDTFAGYDTGHPDAAKRPIVAVQLPPDITWDTSGLGLAPHVLAGMEFIFEKARAIGGALKLASVPVVINFSYGVAGGPHDGGHLLEQGIDALICNRVAPGGDPGQGAPTAVVIASGNGHLRRGHARVRFETADSVPLSWRVLPDDRTSSYLEIWMPPWPAGSDKSSRMTVEIVPPGCQSLGLELIEADGWGYVWAPRGDELARITYDRRAGDGRGRFLVILAPTAVLEDWTQPAPQGVWQVNLRNQALDSAETVEAWIQRDDTPYGYPTRGRQSFLEDPDYERFIRKTDRARFRVTGDVEDEDPSDPDPPLRPFVRRAGAINGLATGQHTVVIGGFRRSDLKPAVYSAGGSATVTAHPDAMAPSDDSRILRGVLGAGTRSGSVAALNGTSTAAPIAARAIADKMGAGLTAAQQAAFGPDAWKAYIRDLADHQEDARADQTGIARRPSMERGGHGRVELTGRIPR